MLSQRVVIALSVLGAAIAGADGYYQIHQAAPVYDLRFWIGMAFGAIAPVGSYLMGLVQTSPWDTKKS